jgi:hypothetical protein
MKRVIYKGVVGNVLSEGRFEQMVVFPYGVRWIPKQDATPTWDKAPRFLKSVKRSAGMDDQPNK